MSASMPLRLIIEDDEGATTIVPLAAEAITIGRQQGNTIQLTEKNVSRNHARLYPEDEIWVIEDLNSYNGIKVNDKSVESRTKLREGDIVQIGDYHLAITEDVDKRTLNYDRPGQAANDGEGDPLLASSSADLPRLSPDEIHALSSGPQPVTPPPSPMMVDSGPVPATPYAPGYAEPRKKGGGLLIALGVLVLGAGAAGAFLITNGSDKESATTAAVDKKDAPTKAEPANPTPPPTPTPADSGAQPPAVPPAAEGGDDSAAEPVPENVPPEPVPPPTEAVDPPTPPPEDPVVIDDTPEPEPEPAPAAVKKKKKPPKPPPTKSTPKPTPAPVDTGPSAAELLKQAQKAQLSRKFREAYNLARESNKKSSSQQALKIMGSAACKLGEKAKAKNAHRKLRGSAKSDVEKLCQFNGITL